LKSTKAPNAKRVHGVKGIHAAHKKAAEQSDTDMFWVVDADSIVTDSFNFDFRIPFYDAAGKTTVYVWESINPVNGLVYGYGGVKLLPKKLVLEMDENGVDMTTSISRFFKPVKTISNINSFNTDPFNTWKSAFRECCKLSSRIINRQDDNETQQRLQSWKTKGEGRRYGNFAIEGAIAGSEYGEKYSNDLDTLAKINDFDFLKDLFEEQYER
jgi:hypothetical protein